MGRAIDLLITYRVIKMLVTPWKQHDAYKLGIIDDNGKVLRKAKTLKSAKEKDSYTILHRFVFNLKRLLGLLPGGKTKFASYATALALLIKENKDINAVELERGLYKHLIENSLFSDCYFYLGYINRDNFKKIQDLHRKPDLIHILKTGFDLESDITKIESEANKLQRVTNSLLTFSHE